MFACCGVYIDSRLACCLTLFITGPMVDTQEYTGLYELGAKQGVLKSFISYS